MDTESTKLYCERQLERMEQVVNFDRSGNWYEDQLRLRALWLQAEQATWLKRIAFALEALASDKQP